MPLEKVRRTFSRGKMSYQVIARKWRPQNFGQLIGQSHISQTLQNAIKNDRLPQALLFTGPRGTGKTSSARILAKALRCPNAVDFVPCGQCDSCQDIATSRAVDVIEIDGASNNGVDAIRELRDSVGYMPSSGKYKVYIIDEVHMLSTSAFNALLKTLEEPPPHVIFIMATTEAHKIPQTILSRCQRFDFRSISTRQISDQLAKICLQENVSAEDEALWMIARQGEGSMRDALSLLEQVITFSNAPLTRDLVVQILGLTDRALLLETLEFLAERNTSGIVDVIEKIFTAGYEPALFAKDLLESVRNLLLTKISSDSHSQILDLPEAEVRFLKNLSQNLNEEEIHLLFDMMLKGASDIPKSSDPRIVLEMVLLRMSQAPRLQQLAEILSGNVTAIKPAAKMAPTAKTAAPAPKAATSAPLKAETAKEKAEERWMNFVQKIRKDDPPFAAKIESLLFLGETNKVLNLAVPAKLAFLKDQLADKATGQQLQELISKEFGAGFGYQIQLSKNEKVGTSAAHIVEKKEKLKEEEIAKKVAEHPLIKSATAAFKGQIKSIKSQQETT
jgi:DNA polymerase III subunit gamma/tau